MAGGEYTSMEYAFERFGLNTMKLRIHGDNIIECDRALDLLVQAYGGIKRRKNTSLYCPTFEVVLDDAVLFDVTLLAGHGRWNVGIDEILAERGAPLREATDAYITRIVDERGTESLIMAVEFCSALPAGNNAWQRSGRAIVCAELGIPYLYFAEIGGVELDGDRIVKAPRFPNPLVPFSYLTASETLDTICLPVYEPHPAISENLYRIFKPVFGFSEALVLIRSVFNGLDSGAARDALIAKGTRLVALLAGARKRVDTLRGEEWDEFRESITAVEKVDFIERNHAGLVWNKKSAEKVAVTRTYAQLLASTIALDCLSVGANGIPICLIPSNKIGRLVEVFRATYGEELIETLANRLNGRQAALLIVWIAGFKPRGDDSRPDRGLIALARMLFGNDIEILTIVSGPAYRSTWNVFREDLPNLVRNNGLWQAIHNLSDFIFVDSATSEHGPMFALANRNVNRVHQDILFTSADSPICFSENDTDTAIHSIFSNREDDGIFECMCNPPRGDWSGISIVNITSRTEYRWTSLPRVSAVNGKRPDHVFQIFGEVPIFLAVESKNKGSDLDADIGLRLIQYVRDLFASLPTASKESGSRWRLNNEGDNPLNRFEVYAGGAFVYRNEAELARELERGGLEFVLALEFSSLHPTKLHIKVTEQCRFLIDLLPQITAEFAGGLEIQIH